MILSRANPLKDESQMAKSKKAQHADLLKSIVADTKSPQGYSLVDPNSVKDLVDAGHIEVNPTITDPSGKIAARATAALIATHEATQTAFTAPKPVFELTGGIPLPEPKRGGKKTEEYPFSQMQVGQSFFVGVTAEYPKPWETFASTVSSATRRFSSPDPSGATHKNRKGEDVPNMIAQRKFTLRQVIKGQTYPNSTFVEQADGARVYRIA
jgi:hypothetical protein